MALFKGRAKRKVEAIGGSEYEFIASYGRLLPDKSIEEMRRDQEAFTHRRVIVRVSPKSGLRELWIEVWKRQR